MGSSVGLLNSLSAGHVIHIDVAEDISSVNVTSFEVGDLSLSLIHI